MFPLHFPVPVLHRVHRWVVLVFQTTKEDKENQALLWLQLIVRFSHIMSFFSELRVIQLPWPSCAS